ncbi:MAG: DUF5666 domain-containing protein [candidate division KSB1 bacterium]|nr:DUF5666 domain-containing protein [candidate division KSB1 bacterium]MDZ7367449.1 DUF5666 domain-containing protein [candidate division KSB1 bacterium]MDZ7405446.1 DUF5666 domain-containing protein [candidate division KSB1 bacterium]
MKKFLFEFTLIAGLLFLAWAPPGHSQNQVGAKIDVFKTLKVGQWVQLEGVPQKDLSVLATEIKFLTGDFQDDDWEVFGEVRAVYRERKEFQILGLKVKVDDKTGFETKETAGKFKSFNDLKAGMLVEIEGSYLKDGTFLAEEVQDETKGKAEEAGTVTLVGKVEKFDPNQRKITVMGITFAITDKTQAKSKIK